MLYNDYPNLIKLTHHTNYTFHQSAAERAEERDTMLTGWLQLNENDSESRQYSYWKLPEYYRWVKNNMTRKYECVKRISGGEKAIRQMYTISMTDQERYYLRLILSHHSKSKRLSFR